MRIVAIDGDKVTDADRVKHAQTVTQQERYERAKSKLKMFETKHGNAYLFPSNQRERALAIKHLQLQDAVSDAYWTDEMEVALRGEFTNEAALTMLEHAVDYLNRGGYPSSDADSDADTQAGELYRLCITGLF